MGNMVYQLKTAAEASDFEAEMVNLNFVIGKYFPSETNVNFHICAAPADMLLLAQQHESTVNPVWNVLGVLKFIVSKTPVKTVLAKQVNTVNNQTFYLFQADPLTIVQMTVQGVA